MPDRDHHKATGGRRSWAGYMRILRTIYDGAQSTKAIAEANGMRTESMREVLRRMLALKLVHISGTEVAANRIKTPLWDIGESPNALNLASNQPMQPNLELIALSYMLRALARGPQSALSLSREAGLHRQRVEEFLNLCHDELRVVYIADYQKGLRVKEGGAPARLFSLGFDHDDAPRPEPMQKAEIWRRSRVRISARRRHRRLLLALAANASIFTRAA